MKKIDRVLKKLSDLYEFNRKLSAYKLKDKAGASNEREESRKGQFTVREKK